jgi:hypothetical protein
LAVADNYSDAGFVLGQEAIAACMNAVSGYPVSFPISAKGVVDMFNNVIGGGTDPVTATANWTAGEVIYYFQSLHP